MAAVANACAQCGPWNVVALAEPLSSSSCAQIKRLFSTVADTTGVVAVGPLARRTRGPVIVALEDVGHLEPMLRTAERLLAGCGDNGITLLLVGASEAETMDMEGQIRLVLGNDREITFARVVVRHGAPGELADRIGRIKGGFVLAQFGGLVAPFDGNLRGLANALECPLFLMR